MKAEDFKKGSWYKAIINSNSWYIEFENITSKGNLKSTRYVLNKSLKGSGLFGKPNDYNWTPDFDYSEILHLIPELSKPKINNSYQLY